MFKQRKVSKCCAFVFTILVFYGEMFGSWPTYDRKLSTICLSHAISIETLSICFIFFSTSTKSFSFDSMASYKKGFFH